MSQNPFLGEIQTFAFGYVPQGFAACNGAILGIAQNQALYALLGALYGGNGTQTFGLPDLRGRVAVNQGNGSGLTPIAMGQIGGFETVTLTTNNLPAHVHPATATSALFAEAIPGDSANPTGRLLASIATGYISPDASPNKQLSTESVTTTVTVGPAGGNQPVPVRDPYLGLNVCIAIQGIFPPRS